jgi:tetratricopeptide (TPR) repeat protein
VRAGLAWQALDPLSPLAHILVAANTWWTGRCTDGTGAMEAAVRLALAGLIFRWGLGNHYAQLGRFDDAMRQANRPQDNAPHFPTSQTLRGLVLGATGRTDEAIALLDTIDMASLDHLHLFHLAESYSAAGVEDHAIELTNRAVGKGFTGIADYCERWSPFHVGLRGRIDFAPVIARARALAAAFTTATS